MNRTTKKALLISFGILIVACAIFYSPLFFYKNIKGNVDTLAELPLIGKDMSSVKTDGPTKYVLMPTMRGKRVYCVGRADEEELIKFITPYGRGPYDEYELRKQIAEEVIMIVGGSEQEKSMGSEGWIASGDTKDNVRIIMIYDQNTRRFMFEAFQMFK